MAKYDALRERLQRGAEPVSLTFDAIADLVGGLPASAYRHDAWWANDATHVQARAWLDAARTITRVDRSGQQVRFSAPAAGK